MKIAQGCPRPLSYRFWKEFLQDSTGKVRMSTPDQFTLILKGTPDGCHKGPYPELSKLFSMNLRTGHPKGYQAKTDQGRPRPLSYRYWKACLQDSKGKLRMSTPDQFILMSKGIPERLPYGNLPRPLSKQNFSINLQRTSYRLPGQNGPRAPQTTVL